MTCIQHGRGFIRFRGTNHLLRQVFTWQGRGREESPLRATSHVFHPDSDAGFCDNIFRVRSIKEYDVCVRPFICTYTIHSINQIHLRKYHHVMTICLNHIYAIYFQLGLFQLPFVENRILFIQSMTFENHQCCVYKDLV